MRTDLVFVYGTLRHGHGNNRALADAEYVGTGRTHCRYRMFDVGWFPALTREKGGPALIVGDVYRVTRGELESLDALEGHPHFYRRQRATIWLDGQRVRPWVYFYQLPTTELREVATGDWNHKHYVGGN